MSDRPTTGKKVSDHLEANVRRATKAEFSDEQDRHLDRAFKWAVIALYTSSDYPVDPDAKF